LQLDALKIAADELYELSSGEKTRYYVDVKRTALHGPMQGSLARLLAAEVNSFLPDAVAGVALGGCHLASIMAATRWEAPLDVIYVRKEAKKHGTKSLVEMPCIQLGARIVLVEDVLTTGGSSLRAMKQLEEAGHEVVGIVAVVDRRAQKDEWLGGARVKCLFTLEELV
jgi:orotate phosphoribosyltransferase